MYNSRLYNFTIVFSIIVSLLFVAPTYTQANENNSDIDVIESFVTNFSIDPDGYSSKNLLIKTPEAQKLCKIAKSGDIPSLEELIDSPLSRQIEALSEYYCQKYGDTIDINTPEREQLRKEVCQKFLLIGSARKTIGADGSKKIVYDGPCKKEFKAELVIGYPAAGKSSRIVDPDSEAMQAFVFDVDVVKSLLPEWQETHGIAEWSVHKEGIVLTEKLVEAFSSGEMKGTNMIIPFPGNDLDYLQRVFINPLEDAGYNVKVKYVHCEKNRSFAKALKRALTTGRIVPPRFLISYYNNPTTPYTTYEALKSMKNRCGEPYIIE